MTQNEIKEILKNIEFSLFEVLFDVDIMEKGDGFLLQLSAHIENNETGKKEQQKGAKYYISSHAIKDEVILTTWKACQDYIIHEAREQFKYKNQTIFQPHYSMDQLAEFCEGADLVKRPINFINQHLADVKQQQDIDT
jgi:hypothetical protein